MKEHMDISRLTWIAAVKLAVVISTVAAMVAVAISTLGHVPDIAIVAIVAVVAFAASWVQTGRARNTAVAMPVSVHIHAR